MKNAAQSAVDAEIIYPLSNDIVFGLVMQDPETDTIALPWISIKQREEHITIN